MPTSGTAPSSFGIPVRRIRWGRVCAAITALLLSSGLHALMIERFPDLPVGRLVDAPVQWSRSPMRVGDVRMRDVSRFDRPEGLSLQDLERRLDLGESARMVAATQPLELPGLPDVSRELLAGADGAVAQPDLDVQRETWEPRRDLLQIDSPLHADEVAALPRRLVSTPEFKAPPPPIEGALARALETLPGLRSDAATAAAPSPAPPVAPATGLGVVPLPSLEFDDPVVPTPIEEEVGQLTEAVAAESEPEVAPFEGVEHLLDLNLLLFRAASETDYHYFALQIRRAPGAELPVLPRDVVLVIDGSQSMTQRTMNASKAGLKAFVDSLSEQDRLEILTFRETVYHAFGELRPASLRTKAEARTFIDRLEAQGRTDIDAGLDAMQLLGFDDARPAIALLFTDGRPTAGVVNSSQIIERFTTENRGRISVFSLGVGRQVNRFLLDMLGFRNRGDLQLAEHNREIGRALRGVQQEVSRPVLSDLRFRFSGVPDAEIYPRSLTNLYLDRPLVVFGRFSGAAPQAAVQIVGRSGAEQKDMIFPLHWEAATPGDEGLGQQWAMNKIYDLIGLHLKTGYDEVLEEVHDLADRYGLHVPYGRDVVFWY